MYLVYYVLQKLKNKYKLSIWIIILNMRFILRYKYGILQTKTQRIDVNFCENTSQLIEFLEKKVNQSKQKFILKFKRGKNYLRIIPGWSLQDYALKEGSQLNIELIQNNDIDEKKSAHINNRYLNNVLGINRFNGAEMQEVKQKQQVEEDDAFNVRKYLDRDCEKMLKEIQKKNIDGFRQIFQEIPEDVPEQFLVEIKQKKMFLIDQLGQKGWGAVHYAIFCQAIDILDQLLNLEVDVNKCTSDGWLPIQLAIDIKNIEIIKKLLEDPDINLNLQTSRGSPLHTAARIESKQILLLLLQNEVDIAIKDNSGKTPYDICLDEQCKSILKKYEDKKQNYNQIAKGNMPLSLTTIIRGSILKAKRPFMSLKQRYLVVDPFQGSIIRYETIQDYPKKAKQITPLSKLKGIKIVTDEQRTWHMKNQLTYFMIEEPNKEIYGCKYPRTAQSWVSNLSLAVKFAAELEKSPHLISEIKRNQLIIEDVQFDLSPKAPKKNRRALFAGSLHSRQSTLSNRSYEKQSNPSEKPPQKLEHSHSAISGQAARKISYEQQQTNGDNDKSEGDKSLKNFQSEFNTIANNKVNFASFDIIKILGSGAFGKVFLVKHIASGKQYALKALKKKNLIVQKQLKYAIIQANILKQANNPFIINLHYAFQTPHYLYLALDYCSGKDLSFHLARQVTFTQDQARFYIAELILAIEHLHQKKIIYRDLKPENILLDGNGHVKLADFGLSKQMGSDDRTKSFCGSPAYLSPQMLSQKGVGKQSDLYGIGTVVFQFLIGEPPYFSDDIPTLYRNIREGKLKFPKNISQNAKSLILGLLERDPKKRLGYNSINEVKQHPFFSTVNWQKLGKLQIKPPIRPELDDSDGSQDQLDIITNKNATKFTDFDYDEQTKKVNRLANFSFVRTQ